MKPKPRKKPDPKPQEPDREVPNSITPFQYKPREYQAPALDIAEKRATLCEVRAKRFQKKGKKEAAALCIAEAKRWRSFARAKLKGKAIDSLRESASGALDLLLVRASEDQSAELILALHLLTKQLHEGIHALAANGIPWAAKLLVDSLTKATDDFNLLANAQRDTFDFLKERDAIPGMISPDAEKTGDNMRLCEMLGIATKHGFGPCMIKQGTRGRRWSIESPANSLAVLAISHIASHREALPMIRLLEGRAKRDLPQWLLDSEKLDPFGPDTWPEWFSVAWKLLAAESVDGRAENHPCFSDKESWGYSKIDAPPLHDGSPSRNTSTRKSRIRDKLFDAFSQLAAGESKRSEQRKGA